MWGSVAGFLSQKGFASKNVWETLPSTIPETLCSKELRGTIWPNYEIVKSDHSRGSNFATFISSRWETSAQSIENKYFSVNLDVESPVRGDRSNHHKWNKVTETLLKRSYFLNPLRLIYGDLLCRERERGGGGEKGRTQKSLRLSLSLSLSLSLFSSLVLQSCSRS
jgi:hypothetical protein